MTQEVFYFHGSKGDSIIVDVIHTDMITDVMTVEHQGKEYKLNFNVFFSYYEGVLDGKSGYLV